MTNMEKVKERIERMRITNPDSNQLCRLLNFVEGLIQEEQRPIMKNNAIEQMVEWLEKQFESDRWNATYKNAVHDCLLMARSLALERPTAKLEGKCPTCHGVIRTTERRPDGDSTCAFGHKHKTADFYKPTPPPQSSLVEKLEEVIKKKSYCDHADECQTEIIQVYEIRQVIAKFKENK